MFTLIRLLVLLTWSALFLLGFSPVEDPSSTPCILIAIMNAILGFCIALDLLYLALNSLDAPGWIQRHPRAGFDALDIALCLLWCCLTLTPWGLIAILTDAASKLFSRWAQALQESHA